MSKHAESSLFILPSVKWFAGLYQQLLAGVATYQELGDRVLRAIKTAHAFRDVARVRELGRVLLSIPIKEYRAIAQYYLVWCDCREFKLRSDMLETIIDQTQTYKAKAFISRAGFEGLKGNIESELYFYTEALNCATDISDYITSSRAIAVIKSKEGFHNSALKDLEKIAPLTRYAEPLAYYDFLNSYAVELGEVGRKYEAHNIIQAVVASPLAFAYPEWRETAEELKLTNRSFAAIDPAPLLPPNVLAMPVSRREGEGLPAWAGRPAQVIKFQKWKRQMDDKKRDDYKPLEEGDLRGMLLGLMDIFVRDEITDEQRYKMYEAVMKIAYEPDNPDDNKPAA
jgi:hypothetical protein